MTYSKAQKLNYATQECECFFPVRVVGLAYELGQKLAEKRGACCGFCRAPYFHAILATVTPVGTTSVVVTARSVLAQVRVHT